MQVLDEVADAQISMCQSLEASLSLSLETFIGTELEEASRLKDKAEEITEEAESSFAKYLHGKNAQSNNNAYNSSTYGSNSGGGGGGAGGDGEQQHPQQQQSSWNKISEGVGNQLGRIGISSGNNHHHNDVSLSPIKGRKGKNSANLDPADKAISAAYLRQNLEEIRYAQANAELKRFQLLKHVDALKVCVLLGKIWYIF